MSDDLISRDAAMLTYQNVCYGISCDECKAKEEDGPCRLVEWVRTLPPAQLERDTQKRVLWTGWKGHRYTRYNCPNCKKPVRNDDVYCHRCGQRLMFPHITFTPYVEGQKQQTIVRWDDE